MKKELDPTPKTDTVLVRAFGKIGNKTHIAKIVPLLKTPDRQLQIEAMKTLAKLADETHAETIRAVLERVKQVDEPTIINIAANTKILSRIDSASICFCSASIRSREFTGVTPA